MNEALPNIIDAIVVTDIKSIMSTPKRSHYASDAHREKCKQYCTNAKITNSNHLRPLQCYVIVLCISLCCTLPCIDRL